MPIRILDFPFFLFFFGLGETDQTSSRKLGVVINMEKEEERKHFFFFFSNFLWFFTFFYVVAFWWLQKGIEMLTNKEVLSLLCLYDLSISMCLLCEVGFDNWVRI